MLGRDTKEEEEERERQNVSKRRIRSLQMGLTPLFTDALADLTHEIADLRLLIALRRVLQRLLSFFLRALAVALLQQGHSQMETIGRIVRVLFDDLL